jgi:hypothetical protein
MLRKRTYRPLVDFLEDRLVPDAYGFTVPTNHARVLFNPTSLAQARAWYAANPFTPSTGDPWNEALASILTSNPANSQTWAQGAISDALGWKDDPTLQSLFQSGTSSSAADQFRYADWFPEVVDWCYPRATADQLNHLENDVGANWGYTHILYSELENNYARTYPWDNYFAGFLRNGVNYMVAAYYDMSASDLSRIQGDLFAVTTSGATNGYWTNFVNWSHDTGLAGGDPSHPGYDGPGVYGEGANGGTPQGSEYGQVLMSYYVVPLITAANSGRDLASETNYFTAAFVNLFNWTTMAPTLNDVGGSTYQLATFGTDDINGGGYTSINEAGRTYIADFSLWVSMTYPTSSVGQAARFYLNTTGITADNYLRAIDAGGTATAPSWSKDWFANGAGELFDTRSAWGPHQEEVYLRAGQWTEGGAGHETRDVATFQVWYNGTWLSKADSGYDTGWLDGTNSYDTASDNGLLFNGSGEYFIGPSGKENYEDYFPVITRLSSNTNYSYVECHVSNSDTQYAYNSAQGAVDRTFLFIRPMNAYLVLDRMAARGNTETFLLHTENTPTIAGGVLTEHNNGNRLVATDLLNTGAVWSSTVQRRDSFGNVVNVRNDDTQTGGTSGVDYFMHLIQVGPDDMTYVPVVATVTTFSDHWHIVLTQGTATSVIDLNKGQTVVTGTPEGDFGYCATCVPTVANLTTGIQGISVTTAGPSWVGGGGAVIPYVPTPLDLTGLYLPSDPLPLPPYGVPTTTIFSPSGSGAAASEPVFVEGSPIWDMVFRPTEDPTFRSDPFYLGGPDLFTPLDTIP